MSGIINSVLISFISSVLLGPILIPILRKLKFGQSILEVGPKWHKKKSGTPIMGGIIFIIGIIISTLLINIDSKAILLLLASLSFGAIGFIDDYIKVVLKRNLGLTASQKFTAQIIVAVTFSLLFYHMGFLDLGIIIPFLSARLVFQWWLYIPFTVLVILATVNSVNLTDGLDGLATGITTVVSIFFTIAAFLFRDSSLMLFSAAVTGGCLAFLLFNAYPAKVFMGDTGSLFLGGVVAFSAITLKLHLILIIVGGIYLIETLSVILQVISFKFTGKRIFKMSPIHHHFELIGWRETKVVSVFVLVTIVLCFIGFMGIYKIHI